MRMAAELQKEGWSAPHSPAAGPFPSAPVLPFRSSSPVPVTRVFLADQNGQRIFGEGPYRLLLAVEETGSLRAAALSMDMAYTKALKILCRAEETLGFALTLRSTGGKKGGGSRLTPEGRQMVEQYALFREECACANRQIYQKIFGQREEPGIAAASPGCVIMASGQGRRFGGNKLMARLAGRPLVEWVLDATEGIFARRVVVTQHADVAALCRQRGAQVVLHDLPGRDDTIRLGLAAVGDAVSGCVFCPADQPLLARESLLAMAEEGARHPGRVLRLGWNGTAGSPVLFPKRLFARLCRLPAGKGGGYLLKELSEELLREASGAAGNTSGSLAGPVRLVSAQKECELWDVDTPQDLAQIAAHLASGVE